jgi:multiple sugar transport system permease protein
MPGEDAILRHASCGVRCAEGVAVSTRVATIERATARKALLSRQLRRDLVGLAFISPWLFGFLAFTFWPMAQSLWLSFTFYDLLTEPRWIGLENYERLLNDARFLKSVRITLTYVIWAVPFKLIAALAIAMLLAQKIRWVGTYRVAYYIPSLIGSSVAVAIMWRRLLGGDGPVNAFLGLLGIQGREWVAHPDTALWSLVALAAWQFGSSMVIFLAGLKQIPAELYEASAVDGASRWQQFWRITIPMLSPVIFFNLIIQTIVAFQVFTQGFIITRGGPLDETLFYSLYLYEKGFQSFEMGYASAMAWVLLAMIALTTLALFKGVGRFVYYETDVDKK